MARPVIMPKFGMTQESATVVRWLRQEGEAVEQGDPILEVETDKTVMEVEAPASGVLGGMRVQPGQVVPVTEVIAYILAAGEALPGGMAAGGAPTPPQRATPLAQKRAAEAGPDVSEVTPADARWVRREDVEAYVAGGRLRATPAARRLARERGLDLAGLAGSGPRGRVQAADVLASPSAVPEAAPAALRETVIPLEGMRRIAEPMQPGCQTAPHIALTVEIDAGAMLALAERLSALAEAAGGARVTITAILVKASAWALFRHPRVNATLQGDGVHLHPTPAVGVTVALEDGLVVPVVRQAGELGLVEIAARLEDLTARAQRRELRPDDVAGGTFTISNLGTCGVKQFTAIINPPQVAILAVGRVAKHAVVLPREEGDEVAVRPVMAMTLSVDHRALDGAEAARFLQDLERALEHPVSMLA